MQKLLLFLAIILSSLAPASAQGDCDGYDYIIDLNGFSCGNSVGEICFVTSADWVHYQQCTGYVVELVYPTESFIYTNLGNFYLHSQTQSLTVLRHQPDFISEGLTIGCLEGTLQVPGTVFTVQVVWAANPGIILETSTFTLDAFPTIGTAGQTTFLSTAIANQLLLPATQAATQGQTIVIEGTLVVDQNYGFGTSPGSMKNEIVLKPGARIEVGTNSAGFGLSSFHADFHGCEDKWDRILIRPNSAYSGSRTSIKDATVAVELQDQSQLSIDRVFMDNNDIGIGSFGTAQKNVDINLFTSPFSGITIQNGQEGAHFENTNLIDFTAYLLVRNMAVHGVYLDHADFIGERNRYYNCQIGVHVATTNDYLTIKNCEFGYGQGGVLSRGSAEMQVSNSDFHDLEYGIGRTSAEPNEHTLIENNTMATCGTNVLALVQPSRAEIQYNELGAEQTNVAVWGLGIGTHKWAVQNNFGMYSGLNNNTGYNVSFLNVRDGRIFKNDFAYSSRYNFSVWGGSDAKIGYNIQANSSFDNIRVNASPSGLIYCNSTDGNTGLTFMNTCSGTTVRGNDMTGTTHNLSYGTPGNALAHTGPQLYTGNIFDLSSGSNRKAINFSSVAVAMQNRYLVGSLAGVQGSAMYPFFTSAFDNWFLKNENQSDYECPPGLVGDDPRTEVLGREVTSHIFLLNAGVETQYGAEVAFDVKLKLFRGLSELSQLAPLNQTNQAWYNTLSAANYGSFVSFEEMYKNASLLVDSEYGQAVQLAQDIQLLKAQLSAMIWYTLSPEMTASPIVIAARKALYDGKIAALESKVGTLQAMLSNRRQNFLTQWTNLNNLNNSINTAGTVSAQNLKSANQLLLKRVSASFTGYTESEGNLLQNIANQCYSAGGEGVLVARALLAETNLSVSAYNDECMTGTERNDFATANNTGIMSIAPNPVSDVAIVSLPETRAYQTLVVFDLFGREVQRIELAEGQMTAQIATSTFASGVYFLVPAGQPGDVLKFVVNK